MSSESQAVVEEIATSEVEETSKSRTPSPAKRTRRKSRSRSRTRSRSRSAGRKVTTKRTAKSSSPVRKRTPRSVASNGDITPPRSSLRLRERHQDNGDLSPTKLTERSTDAKEKGDAVEEMNRKQATEKSSSTSTSSTTNSVHTEAIGFGGPIGGAALTLFLPATVYYITLTCNKANGCSVLQIPSCPDTLSAFFDLKAFAVVLAWYVFQAILALLPLGPTAQGQPLKNGKRLEYRCNGFLALLISCIVWWVAYFYDAPMDWINKHWLQVVTAGIVYSYLIAIWMYVKALRAPVENLAPESTGNFFNDFFMGRELNPRCNHMDYKFFFELRPGLIGWMFIDWCLVAAQYKTTATISPALGLVTLFQTLYVFDALKSESAILTTLDITTEGFGFMLAFGDLAWVPYLYSLQANFLYNFPQESVRNPYALVAICALEALGLLLFRGANSQKNEFRSNPNSPSVSHLKTIPTASGKKLLCDGFWAICRRPNYLGDLMLALAWSLPCGFNHILPYFYPIYFFVLLAHRCQRDETYCKQKYGEAWDRYCKAVPYKIIPYIY